MWVSAMFIRNKEGIEGMPLKLVIISIMISICAPMLAGALRSYEVESSSVLLYDTIEKIQDTAEEVFVSGPGNSRSLNVHVPEAPGRHLMLGGPSYSESISISIIEAGLELERVYLTDPTIRLITPDPDGLIIESDTIIMMRCIEVAGERYVEVTV